jgi:hypothetical protein
MISAELEQRYQACLVCERQGKDFDPDAGEKCVEKANPLSLRSKLEKWAGMSVDEKPDAVTELANQQARQRQIDNEAKQRVTAEQERRRRESDVSGAGGSASRNAEELAKLNSEMEDMELSRKKEAERRNEQELAALNSEMESMEARQKKEANRRKFDQQMKAADKLFNFDEPSPPKEPSRAERSPPPPPDEFGPNVAVFEVTNTWKYTVHLNFHSRGGHAIWPGNGKAYVLDDSRAHKVRLSCQPGEKICYGAWSASNRNTYWGVGPDGDQGCDNCCAVCGGTVVSRHSLIYVPGRDGGSGHTSSNAVSAVDLLGAAIGIAGAVAGSSGGGGGGSYRAPSVPRGGVPRNRESGVSGGR